MSLLLVGLSHKTAPIEIREKVAIDEKLIPDCLGRLLCSAEVKEVFILSTCNRVEILMNGTHLHHCVDLAKELLERDHCIDRTELEKYLYTYFDADAIRHFFKVTSSLDSMVVGEPQILGQVKDAYRTAVMSQACGPILNKVLHHAFRVAKRVRTDTGIAKNAVSVSYAAVELARSIFESLSDKTIFLIGAGEMIELAARHFLQQGVSRILITNRTYSRSEDLAGDFGGEPILFEEFRRRLHEVDIILSCTGSQHPIIDVEDVKRTLRLRRNLPMFLIDIAVPRDIDPSVNDLENVYLYDIDDLQQMVDSNRAQRMNELNSALGIVESEVSSFNSWIESLELTPTLKEIRAMAEDMRAQELKKTIKQFKNLSEKEKKSLDLMTRAIVNKILHPVLTQIKQEGIVNGQSWYLNAARKLFGLDREDRDDS